MNTPITDELLKIAAAETPAETDDFFYTRLRAHMERVYDNPSSKFSLRPSLLVGMLSLLLFINGYIFTKKEKPVAPNTGTELQTFASSYDLTVTTPY